MARLSEILQWVRDNGEVRAFDRVRLYTLSASISERVSLSKVTADTTCSDEYLSLVRKVASEVVGKRCPF